MDVSLMDETESAMSSLSWKRMLEQEETEILVAENKLKMRQKEKKSKDEGSDVTSLSIYSQQGNSPYSITRETDEDSCADSENQ